MNCPYCGAGESFVVPVWENPNDFERGEEPDYIGCQECETMQPWEVEDIEGEVRCNSGGAQ